MVATAATAAVVVVLMLMLAAPTLNLPVRLAALPTAAAAALAWAALTCFTEAALR